MPKGKRNAKPAKAVATKVSVVTSAMVVEVGNDNYLLKPTNDGRGVRVENSGGSIFIPFGQAGKAILRTLGQLQPATVKATPKRTRRTKAQIAADRAALDAEINAESAAAETAGA